MSGRNVARWLARKAPKAARELVLLLNDDPTATWAVNDLPEDRDHMAEEIDGLAQAHAEEIDGACIVRLVWTGPGGRELTTHTYHVGVATGDARLDGSASASAHNAQRHVEAMVRLMVQQTQTLSRSWAELGQAHQTRATDAEREARKLRDELRQLRDQLDGREPQEPSAMDGVVEQLMPALMAGIANAAAGAPPAPSGTEPSSQ